MVFSSPFKTMAEVSSTSVEQSFRMIETLQETLMQKRRQLEDIQSRQRSLIQEFEQLDAVAKDMAQKFSGVMKDFEPQNSAPVHLGNAGLGEEHKAKRWKASAILAAKVVKPRDEQVA